MFLKLDGTFWVQIINFIVFYALLDVIFLRPVQRAIKSRRALIDGIQSEYDHAMEEIATLKTSGESQKATNRRAIEENLTKVRAAASDEAALITTRASSLAHDRIAKAQGVVAAEMQSASQRLDGLADDLAGSLLGRVLGAS